MDIVSILSKDHDTQIHGNDNVIGIVLIFSKGNVMIWSASHTGDQHRCQELTNDRLETREAHDPANENCTEGVDTTAVVKRPALTVLTLAHCTTGTHH